MNIVFLFINDYKEKCYTTCIARCYLTHYCKVTNIFWIKCYTDVFEATSREPTIFKTFYFCCIKHYVSVNKILKTSWDDSLVTAQF